VPLAEVILTSTDPPFPNRFTMDSATEFLFGSNVHSLHASLEYAHNSPLHNTKSQPHSSSQFAEAFSQAQSQIALRTRLTWMWPLFEFWKDKTKDSMTVIYDFIDPILKDALAKKAAGEKSVDSTRSETLLDHLVAQTDGEQDRVISESFCRCSSYHYQHKTPWL
jgi:hypothetical protein